MVYSVSERPGKLSENNIVNISQIGGANGYAEERFF